MENNKRVELRLPENLKKRLEKYAKSNNETLSEVVRQLVVNLLKRRVKK